MEEILISQINLIIVYELYNTQKGQKSFPLVFELNWPLFTKAEHKINFKKIHSEEIYQFNFVTVNNLVLVV